jgi:transcriptional regulator with XRE-family HTH domain
MQASGPITFVKSEVGTPPGVGSTLAARMKWARGERKLSQPALAKLAGVSQGTIGNIESGDRKQPRKLLAIARALYCNPEWLETGKGEWDGAKAGSAPPAVAREKGAAYHQAPSPEERDMLEVWRRMSPSDRKAMLVDMLDKAERYQADVQQSLDEAGVQLPFPLTSPLRANATTKAAIARASTAPTGQKQLPLESSRRK